MSRRGIAFLLFTGLSLIAAVTNAQQHPNVKKGFAVDGVFQSGEIDQVNAFNGNLMVQIPLGPRFHVGGPLSYGLTLTYNSKVWDYEGAIGGNLGVGKTPINVTPTASGNAGLGWQLSLGRILLSTHPANHSGRLTYESPDGAQHRIYCTLHQDETPVAPIVCETGVDVDPGMVQGYTRDGTYLRMKQEQKVNGLMRASIEFPDGSRHLFELDDPNDQMRIVSMQDRFNNSVTITYTPTSWTLTDSASPDRKVVVNFEASSPEPTGNQPRRPKNYDTRVANVQVSQSGTSQLARYDFHYSENVPVTRPTLAENFTYVFGTTTPNLPELTSIDLPAGGGRYSFQYLNSQEHVLPDDGPGTGSVKSITLPTRGRIDYTWQGYALPTNGCTKASLLNLTGGVKTRTVIEPATKTSYLFDYTQTPGGTSNQWEDCGAIAGVLPSYQQSTTVVDVKETRDSATTLQQRITNYFSIWAQPDKNGFKRMEYGLPLTHASGKDGLSTETTNPASGKTTKTYVTYDLDPWTTDLLAPPSLDRNRRLSSIRTVDDNNSSSQTTYEDFDGLGHYRKVTTSGFGAPNRVTYTAYNPGRSIPQPNGQDVPPTLPHDADWLLELYASRTVTEGTTTLTTEFCFDTATGFLKARRTKSKSGEGPDFLTVFTHDGYGNIAHEKYYGGDETPDMPSGCEDPKATQTPGYDIARTYLYGTLQTMTSVGSGFYSVNNNAIDRYTGLVTQSSDPTGLVTTMTYDALGRLKSVTPAAGHGPKFTYDYKIDGTSPTVDVKAFGNSANTSQLDRKFVRFDGLGRLWLDFDQMPASGSSWSLRAVNYDFRNQQTKVLQRKDVTQSDPSSLPSLSGSDPATTFTYDYLGRPVTIKSPDGKTISYTYVGSSSTTETVRRVNADGVSERDAPTTRSYDYHGRLTQVDELSGNTSSSKPSGDKVATKYTYDLRDNLIKVDMGGKQSRTFDYALRGTLKSETHPENGTTSYSDYDARGNATTRVNGSTTLTFIFDKAERVQSVTDQNNHVLKQFTYGKENDGNARGKLLQAIRRNYLSSGEVDVTEDYVYNGAARQMSNRTTTVESVSAGGARTTVQKFDYGVTYDDLLLPGDITMPRCSVGGCSVPTGSALDKVTNVRTDGYLTSVNATVLGATAPTAVASMTYHASGSVERVVHATANQPSDTYDESNGIPRPSKVTFSPCGSRGPTFLPGAVVAQANLSTPSRPGIQLSWPPATVCGGSGSVVYQVLRDGHPLSGCLPAGTIKFTDYSGIATDTTYTYQIQAEGPAAPGGTGQCQSGMTSLSTPVSITIRSVDANTSLTVTPPAIAYVGVPATYSATLTSSNGPVQGERLAFSVNGISLGSAVTGADGTAMVSHAVDVEPNTYNDAIQVVYAGGLLPGRTASGTLRLVCGVPSYTVKPTWINLPLGGGQAGVFVGTSDHCAWGPQPDGSFLTVDSTATRKGTGSFTINVPQNPTNEPRTAGVSVALQRVTVVQNGSGCTYRFVPELAYVPAASGAGMVSMDVVAAADCAWRVSSGSTWVRFQPPPGSSVPKTSGTGTGTIYFSVDPYTGTQKRSAELTISDASGTAMAKGWVNQDAIPPATCPGPLLIDLDGGSVTNERFISMRVYTNVGTDLHYHWYVDDMPIAFDGPELFLVPNNGAYPPPGQSRHYQVEVYNNCGSVMSQRVTWSNGSVAGECKYPIITDGWYHDAPFDSYSPYPGYQNLLYAVGSHHWSGGGTGDIIYKWYRGLPGDKSSPLPVDPSLPPDSVHVSPFATSFYWVEVSDSCGSQYSRSAMVTVTNVPPRRRRAVSHDFTGDNRSDLVWQNPTTGQNEIWAMTGTAHSGTVALPSNPDPNALIQSTGDINADGNTDLIWRDPQTGANQVWLMNRTQRVSAVSLETKPDAHWTIGAVADYDDDNNDDIVWHNSATGANEIWFQSGTDHTGSWALPSSDAATGLYGTGDFDGDQTPDLFFHNNVTGENQIWLIDNARLSATSMDVSATTARRQLHASVLSMPTMSDTNWVPSTVADMDGDGRPDVVWRNRATGENSVWIMSGTQVSQTVTVEPRTDTTWEIGGGGSNNSGETTPGGGGPGGSGPTAISLSVDPTSVGKPTAATATLTASGTAVAGRQLVFSLNGSEVSRLITDANGTAVAVFGTGSLAAGTYDGAVSARFDGDSAYSASSASAALVIAGQAPALTWDEPAPIVYGTQLTAAQLNATASAPGAFVYDPAAGTTLDAGYHTLSVTFTPADGTLAPVSRSVVLLVQKAPATVTWATPSPIDYGVPLSAIQLNAASTMPGTFTYDPDAGTVLAVGRQTLNVTFAPDDPNYDSATASTTIDVGRGTQYVLWDNPLPITALDPLGPAQLNATVIPAGTAPAGQLVYDPPAGTLLPPGVHTLRVTAAATPQYDATGASVQLLVNRVVPSLQWATPAPIVYGTPLSTAQLNATADVPGTFFYSYDPGTILDAGEQELNVRFVPDDDRYEAVPATVLLQVTKAPQSISWSKPEAIVYGTPLSASQLSATVQVVGPAPAGPLTYAPPAGTVLQAGPGQTLTLNVDETSNYQAATASVTIDVLKATPVITWAAPPPIVYGTALGADQLGATADVDGTFVYTPPAGTILDAGAGQTLAAHFTPSDTHNYESVDTTRTIDVARARQKLVWTAPAPIVYGTALSAAQLNATVEVVGPSPAGGLTYAPAAGTVLDAGPAQTLTVTAAETRNYEAATANVPIDVARAPLSLVVDAKSKLYGGVVPPLTGTLTGVVNHDPITPTYSTLATQQSGAGQYPITGTLVDPNHRLSNYDVTITPATLTVIPAPLQISANPVTKQYSDPLPPLTATYVGLVLGETPAVLNGTLVIQAAGDALSGPGTYPISIGGVSSPNYAITFIGSTLTVTQEDARVFLTSPTLLSASAAGTTTVILSATVQDISATADAAGDVNPGDIRNATLTFVDRATGATLCTAPIGLLAPPDTQTGTALCTFTRDFGTALPASLTVGANLGGYYLREAAADDATLTVAAPTGDQVTGGGRVTITSAAGPYSPDTGIDAQYDLALRYDRNNAVTGTFRFVFTHTENGSSHRYELTPASLASLAILRTNPGGTATIVATGTLVDTTDKKTIAAAAPFFITATDSGQNTPHGYLSVMLLKPEGGIWLATGWNGVQPVPQPIQTGAVQVGYRK